MAAKNEYRKLATNSVMFLIGSIGSKFITFFLVPLYTNILTKAEYGITDIVSTSVILCIPIFSLSLDDGIMRFGLMKNTPKENIAVNIMFVLTGSIIAVFASYPLFKLFDLFENWTIYFCVILVLHIIRNAFSIYLKSVDKVRIFTIDSIIYAATLGISNVVLLKSLHLGVRGYFLALIISMAVSLVSQFFGGGIYKDVIAGEYDKKLLISMLKYSTPLILSAISWWVINSSDRYMLKYMMSYESVGLYAISAKIPNFIGVFTSVFSSAWLISSISEYEGAKDKNFYSNVFSLYTTFLAVAASFIMLVLKPFMSIYVGLEFIESWKYVPFLLVAAVCGTLVSFFTPIFKAELRNLHEMIVVIIGAISNVVINYLLIPVLGIQGASIGTVSSETLMLVLCVIGTRRFFSFEIDFVRFIGSLVLLLLQATILILFDNIAIFASTIVLLIICILNMDMIKRVVGVGMNKLKRGHT